VPRDTKGRAGTALQAVAATFDLLSAPTRLRLMWLLARCDYDVGSLARTGASIAVVSQHLAKLRLAGLVTARRDGCRHIYAVEDPHVLTLIDQIFAHIAPDGTLAPDPPAPHRASPREGQVPAAETTASAAAGPGRRRAARRRSAGTPPAGAGSAHQTSRRRSGPRVPAG
jgi:DNA-binding transcriptional ArsR family regulator